MQLKRLQAILSALTIASFVFGNPRAFSAPSEPASGASASTSPTTGKDIIHMDPIVVEATRIDGRPWKYASIPGFEIISKCQDSKTYGYINSILLGQKIEQSMFPSGCLTPVSTPIPVILYDREPNTSGNLIPLPTPTVTLSEQEFLGGLINYQGGPVIEADELDYPIICENLYDSPNLDAPSSFRVSDLRFRLSHRAPKFPPWLIAGLIGKYGVYSRLQIILEANSRNYTAARWGSAAETESIRSGKPPTTKCLPIQSLFFPGNYGPNYDSDLWSAEAALFVRWALFGRPEHSISQRKAFWTFINKATDEGRITEQMFHECFGFGYAEMQNILQAYIPRAVKNMIHEDFIPVIHRPDIKLREATPAEIARMVGDWECTRGVSLAVSHQDESDEYLHQAGMVLLKPYTAGSRDPELLGELGLYEHAIGSDDKARAFLEEADKTHIDRPAECLELAQLRYTDFKAHPAGPEGKFTAGQMTAILKPLFDARTRAPAMVQTYILIAEAWEESAVKPTPENLAAIDEGARLFWGNRQLRDMATRVRAQWGYKPTAADPSQTTP